MRPYHRQTGDHRNLCGSADPPVDYIHDVTCDDCVRLMTAALLNGLERS